jgi:enamine deaminase RidA (YjgF/YER057c/UK114 family)
MQESDNNNSRADVSRRRLVAAGLTAGVAIAAQAAPASAQVTAPKGVRKNITNEITQGRTYSEAVVTQGGRTIWLAGVAESKDAAGKSLAGNFEGQARAVFASIKKTLESEGGKLTDLVTMTCFLKDARHRQILKDLRKELFVDTFPASAMITVSAFNEPDLLLEIQAVAFLP